MDEQLTLFKALTEAPSVPGNEDAVREIMRSYLSHYSEEIVTDHLGSIFGKKVGDANGPVIMAAGHMDEVGFMVTSINKEGFIRFQTLGGWWEQVLLGQRVSILTEKGEIVGVIGSKPPHILPAAERSKPVQLNSMFIDIGVSSQEEAEAAGVKPGQSIVPICPFEIMANPKYLMAKAWDNRYGCAMSIELMRNLHKEKLPNTLYAGATVQEEVGLRGAQTAAHRINPDLGLVFDAGPCLDTPGITPDITYSKLGGGAAIRIVDRSMVTHKKLLEFVLDIAETHKVPYQFFVSQGGTDAGRIHLHGSGVPTIAIGIASRYIHSHASIMHRDDFDAAQTLTTKLVQALDRSVYETIVGY